MGVGFTCNNELHGALFVEQDTAQTLRVTQHQGQALVGGHATRETNGQGVRIEYALGPVQLCIGQATVCPGIMHGLAGHVHQVGPQLVASLPQGFIIHGIREVPAVCHGKVGVARDLLNNAHHLWLHPGGQVHTVGDGPDRHFLVDVAGVQAGEHLTRYFTVQLSDAVRML